MTLSNPDRLLLQRYLDGALDDGAAAAFAARLVAEPALRQHFDDARALRSVLQAGAVAVRRPPADFTAELLARARRLPTRDQMQREDVLLDAARLCRLLLLAAVVLLTVGIAWRSGLLVAAPVELQATPDEVRREIERLDALIHAESAPTAPRGGR